MVCEAKDACQLPSRTGRENPLYGTRFVEYLTVRRVDELDRMAEVIATDMQDAMRQLWTARASSVDTDI